MRRTTRERGRKAVHLTAVHSPQDVRILDKQCVSLQRAGYEVVLVAPWPQDDILQGIRIRALTPPRSRARRMTWTGVQLLRAALNEGADLYHVHDPELLGVLTVLRAMGKLVVFDMHEHLPKVLLTKSWVPGWARKPASVTLAAMERLLLSGVPVVFAEDSYVSDYGYVGHSATVRNFADLSVLSTLKRPKRSKPTLVYIGRLAASRGSFQMIEAVRRLRAGGMEVELELIGPADPSHLREIEAKLDGLTSAVRIRGRLSGPDAWGLTAECHIGLAVLAEVPNYVESYPTKLFEYMSLGLPVIASDFPLYREVVDGAGLCVDPSDAAALAAAAAQLLNLPDRGSALGARGRTIVQERYSWKSQEQNLLEFYDSLMETG